MNARARRRGGRGRRRPPRPEPPPRISLWRRLLGMLGLGAKPKPATPRPRRGGEPVGAQEDQVFREFSRQYGIPFNDITLLKLALTHRSYLSVTGQGARESNERLEFLGDSVLGLVTSEFLYRRHPDEHEGQLTKVKSLLVSKAILSRRALKMGLGRFVLMSHSEVESGGRQRLSILADAFESVLGAVYLDQGFETARRFIHDHLLADADAIVADKRHTNYKSHLQEYVQSTYRTHPVYRIRSEYGPDHSKHFLVEVMVGRRMLGEGRGHNKKEAEQAAARDAIERVTELRREASEARRPERESGVAAPLLESDAESEADEDTPRRGRRRRGGRSRDPRHGRERVEPVDAERETVDARPAVTSSDMRLVGAVTDADEPSRDFDPELELEDDEETDEIEVGESDEPGVDDDLTDDDEDVDDDEDLDDEAETDETVETEDAFEPPVDMRPGGKSPAAASPTRLDIVDSPRPAARAPIASSPPVAPAAVTSYGRGRRGARSTPPAPDRTPEEPTAIEEQRHVDPFALDAPEPAARSAASDESAPSRGRSAAEPEREALIDEMERAMENFGRRSRPGRRRRSR